MLQDNPNNNETPIIPPAVLLGVAVLGLIIAFGNAFMNQQMGFLGYAGLIIAVLSMVFWGVTNPQAVMNIFRGRFFVFGGTAVVVAVVFALALTLVYIVVREQGWRADLSENNNFSLTEQGKEVITLLGNDPTTPKMLVSVFYGSAQASTRDLAAVLLDDVSGNSNGKVTYRFIDPDRDPLTVQKFTAKVGQAAVSLVKDDGTPDLDNTKLIDSLDQQTLLDALVTASATGDFRAYFLNLSDAISIEDDTAGGAKLFATDLTDKYKWKAQAVTLSDLQTGAVNLNEASDGRVLVLLGGQSALPDDQLKLITDFVDGGGSLVVFADINLKGDPTLTTASNFNTYLTEKFGITINNDLVLDQKFSSPQDPTQIYVSSFGTTTLTTGYDPKNDALLMVTTHSLTVAPTPPTDVTLNIVASTSPEAYSKAGLDLTKEIKLTDLNQAAGDVTGALPVVVEAENAKTGSKVVVFGSTSLAYNQFRQYDSLGLRNLDIARKALFWAAGYESYASTIASMPTTPTAQQQPLQATDEQISFINLVSLIGLPFGVAAFGVFMWWLRRERVTA